MFLPLIVWIGPEAQHSETDETLWKMVFRPIIFTQLVTDTGLLVYVHLYFSDKFIFLPEQGVDFLDLTFARKYV